MKSNHRFGNSWKEFQEIMNQSLSLGSLHPQNNKNYHNHKRKHKMNLKEIKTDEYIESVNTTAKNSDEPQIEEYREGKWCSVHIEANTYYYMIEIKKRLLQMNVRVSRNDIIKRLLLLGTDNLCLDAVLHNPLALWSKSVEEDLV